MRIARFDDDRMYVHRIANLIEAYVDWSSTSIRRTTTDTAASGLTASRRFPAAGLAIFADDRRQLIVSAARGGTFCYSSADGDEPCVTDAGIVVELSDGRTAASQTHVPGPCVDWAEEGAAITCPLRFVRFERVTPWKQALLQLGMCTFGRVARSLCRSLLQRRVIRGGGEAPLRLTRRFECRRRNLPM